MTSKHALVAREKTVTEVLNAGNSRYYKYAISDLKKAKAFSENVKNWSGIVKYAQFISDLYERYKFKRSFWQLCKENNLAVTAEA